MSEDCGLEIVFFVCVECDVRSLSLTLSFPRYGKKFIYQVATYMYLPTHLPTVTECIEWNGSVGITKDVSFFHLCYQEK